MKQAKIIEVYAAESAVLRAQKLAARNGEEAAGCGHFSAAASSRWIVLRCASQWHCIRTGTPISVSLGTGGATARTVSTTYLVGEVRHVGNGWI